MIQVTKTYLPDIKKYMSYVEKIYESGRLTNGGQFVEELQSRLAAYLGVKNLLLMTNGTLALQIAYRVLGLKGDVLTTPFSFVATTSSLVWEGLNPVFADIDPETMNIDPKQLEERITQNTTAIVVTHVFGNPCELDEINRIARKYGLRVIYDAAHAFDVKYGNQSVLNFGDVSMVSFHSTKLFHSIEGGALVFRDDAMYERAKRVINFGIDDSQNIQELGINAKMNEFQAAMGLCVLDEMETIKASRALRYRKYVQSLRHIAGVFLQKWNKNSSQNYNYFPIVFESEETMLRVLEQLNALQIYPRRYFYPSLDLIPYAQGDRPMPISRDIAGRILCLPLYHSLEKSTQDIIIQTVREQVLSIKRAVY